MKQTLTSKLTTEELYDLATETIEYCSDGKVLDIDLKQKGLLFQIDDMNYFELTDNCISLNENFIASDALEISPEQLKNLFILFESVTDYYEQSSNKNKEEWNKEVDIMDIKKVNVIKLDILKQAQLAMKQAVENDNSAMVAAIAELLKAII